MGDGMMVRYSELILLVITTLIGLWVKYLFHLRDKKDVEISRLQEEKEELKEKAIQDWRKLYSDQLISVRDAQTKILDLLNRHEKRFVRLENQKEDR